MRTFSRKYGVIRIERNTYIVCAIKVQYFVGSVDTTAYLLVYSQFVEQVDDVKLTQ
jgi:hypothetical protein